MYNDELAFNLILIWLSFTYSYIIFLLVLVTGVWEENASLCFVEDIGMNVDLSMKMSRNGMCTEEERKNESWAEGQNYFWFIKLLIPWTLVK